MRSPKLYRLVLNISCNTSEGYTCIGVYKNSASHTIDWEAKGVHIATKGFTGTPRYIKRIFLRFLKLPRSLSTSLMPSQHFSL